MNLFNLLTWNVTFLLGMGIGWNLPRFLVFLNVLAPDSLKYHAATGLICGFVSWLFLTWPAYKWQGMMPQAPGCPNPGCSGPGYDFAGAVSFESEDFTRYRCRNCGQVLLVQPPYRIQFMNDDQTVYRTLRLTFPYFLGIWRPARGDNRGGLEAPTRR